ncbi:MAG: dihydrodipicolinate synthase family protein [Actinomycetota bacterium]|nr:dihydrodipicolinate synthase family protein [Actinomycetota bacterium]
MNGAGPSDLLRPGRPILGASAVLLPFGDDGQPDETAFAGLLERTVSAGLVPAVNMDTGYGALLSPEQRQHLVVLAQKVIGGPDGPKRPQVGSASLIAAAYADDRPGARWDAETAIASVEAVARCGAIPVVFPSHGLASLAPDALVDAFRSIGDRCDQFIAFELGEMFSPAGRIWDLDTFCAVMAIPSCIGAKHSSLRRGPEWERLRRRDAERPDFHVFTGNDLAIDMVMYGSDYLLGLSAFAPDLFAARDRAWNDADPSFSERNDDLQALGAFAFRAPVPAYKHSAAQFLRLRGWLTSDTPPPDAPRRPDSDRDILATLLARLERWL